MTSTQVLDLKGNKTHEITLNDDVFAAEVKVGTMHTALLRQLANGRAGSANTKTRAEVRGGGAKPWRQKGTGRARAGSRRSPLWEGGGVTFGPKPRDYSIAMPRKARMVAVRSALASKRDALIIIKTFDDFKEIKTKAIVEIYKALKVEGKKVLLILDHSAENHKIVSRSARNIEGTTVVHVSNLNVKDIIHADFILTTESAIDVITKRFETIGKSGKEAPVKGAKAPKAKVAKDSKSEAKPAKAQAKEAFKDKAPKAKTTEKKEVASKDEAAEAKPAKKPETKPEAKTETHDAEAKKAAPKKAAKEEAPEAPAKPKKKAKEEE
jgi:large subunit ribosomal protein L4